MPAQRAFGVPGQDGDASPVGRVAKPAQRHREATLVAVAAPLVGQPGPAG